MFIRLIISHFKTKEIIKSCTVDYVHVNHLKHGFVVKHVADWAYSTFHQYVAQGIYLPCSVVI